MILIPENGFRKKRAQQLCAFLMRWEGATRFSVAKCAALLYLAERQCYGEHGMPLTYDRVRCTPVGPALVNTLSVLLSMKSPHETMSEFSTDEIESIDCAFQVYSTDTEDELLRQLLSLKEWKYNGPDADNLISLETILECVGFADEEIIPQIANILDTQVNATSSVPA